MNTSHVTHGRSKGWRWYILIVTVLVSPVMIGIWHELTVGPGWVLVTLVNAVCVSGVVFSGLSITDRTILRFAVASVIFTTTMFFNLLLSVSLYLQSASFNLQFFFHFEWSVVANYWRAYPLVASMAVFDLLLVQLLAYLLARNSRVPVKRPIILLLAFMVGVATLPSAAREFFMVRLELSGKPVVVGDMTELTALGLNLNAINQTDISADPGKNLLLIYLEGLEHIYTEDSIFPGLTPNLRALGKQGLTIPNYKQVQNAGWTMGGIVASQCGTPLVVNSSSHGNDILLNGYFNEAFCLGDVLKLAQYEQSFIGGADVKFAGKEAFFTNHGYNNVKGIAELSGGAHRKDESHRWGLFDDVMYRFAVEEYLRLAELGQPFNLTLLTLDTHHPVGYLSKSCKPYEYSDDRMLNTVHCADQLIQKFLSEISAHPQYENTVVVLLSDHLSLAREHRNRMFPESYKRKPYFAVLNAGSIAPVQGTGTVLDMAPSILSLLGVRHNAEFLVGSNLIEKRLMQPIPDFERVNTWQNIRWVNSQLLSNYQYSLCSKDNAVEFMEPSLLRIGTKLIATSYRGSHRKFVKDFENGELVILLFARGDGEIVDSSVSLIAKLPSLLEAHKNEYFLLLAASKKLPGELAELVQGRGSKVFVLGGWKQAQLLGTFDTLDAVRVDGDLCEILQ